MHLTRKYISVSVFALTTNLLKHFEMTNLNVLCVLLKRHTVSQPMSENQCVKEAFGKKKIGFFFAFL